MGQHGLVRVCLRDKACRLSGLTRPWRIPALVAALEADPETIPDLLVAAQRFFGGHPFCQTAYDGLLGSIRRIRLDRRYTETPGTHGVAVIDLEARRVRYEVRGVSWRRAGWLYYHDGEAFTRRRVVYRVPESWLIDGVAEDVAPLVEWNEHGPEAFGFLLGPDA
jgi:hypothetical protein